MGQPHWQEWLPPLDEAARLGKMADVGLALRYAIIAAELRDVGIDGNFAPLGDIARPETHAILRNRCYGGDSGSVLTRARAVATALVEGGVLPVVKHIPGQGRAVLDSHAELPHVGESTAELRGSDFAVFQGLNDLPIGMSAHVVFSAIDDRPVTTSPRMVRLIRKEIGFSGLLMTDDISMKALLGDVGSRARAAISAGCDLVLHCNGEMAEMEVIAELGPMSGEAANRANRALETRKPQRQVDMDGLLSDFAALFRRAG